MNKTNILIEFAGTGFVEAELVDQVSPRTYAAFLSKIPFESTASVWGDEIYFETPITTKTENGKTEMEIGDIAYWPPGRAMCLFFGPTPASKGSSPVAASPVNLIGKITKNIQLLHNVQDDKRIVVKLR